MSLTFATLPASRAAATRAALNEAHVPVAPAPALRGASSAAGVGSFACAASVVTGVVIVSKAARRHGRRAVKVAAVKDKAVVSKQTTDDGTLSLGQGVTWNGKAGIVRYIGDVRFASGEWVGVELVQPQGMHDGTVLGVPYFSCADKKGAFAQPAQLEPGAAPSSMGGGGMGMATSVAPKKAGIPIWLF